MTTEITETEITDEADVAAPTRQEAAWARMEETVRRSAAPVPQTARQAPVATRSRAAHRRPRRRLRTVLIALLVVSVAVAAVVVARQVHRTTPAAPTPRAAAPASTTTSTARLDSATTDAQAAVAAARAGLAGLSGIPTPSSVAPVTDALASSLRLYGTALAVTPAPAPARTAVKAVAAQVESDSTRLQGVATMSPALLGAFLQDLTTHADRLDAALGSLRHVLERPSSPH
jgi:hypothetical protein